MLVILFGRVMLLDADTDNKHGSILYIVPKVIKSVATLRINLKKEKKCLAQHTQMLMPVLVGEYDLTRFALAKLCREDTILQKNINQNLFTHWEFKDKPFDVNVFNNIMIDIQLRLQFIMKPREMNGPLGFDNLLNKNLINYKGFCAVRKYQTIEEEA